MQQKEIQESWENHNGMPVKCVMDVSRNAKHMFGKWMNIDGISAEKGRILSYIGKRQQTGEKVYQKDIEKICRLRKSSVTSVLKILENDGYIKRENEEKDARYKKLSLTHKGCDIYDKACDRLMILENEVRNILTQEEYINFIEYMKKIDDKITELGGRDI